MPRGNKVGGIDHETGCERGLFDAIEVEAPNASDASGTRREQTEPSRSDSTTDGDLGGGEYEEMKRIPGGMPFRRDRGQDQDPGRRPKRRSGHPQP